MMNLFWSYHDYYKCIHCFTVIKVINCLIYDILHNDYFIFIFYSVNYAIYFVFAIHAFFSPNVTFFPICVCLVQNLKKRGENFYRTELVNMVSFLLLFVSLFNLTLSSPALLSLEILNNAAYPNALCNDGTSAGYYFNLSTSSPPSEYWIIHLEGYIVNIYYLSLFCFNIYAYIYV